MKVYFEVTFSDLEWDKQQELIATVAEDILDKALDEAKSYIEGEQTAEEAYCRTYSIGFDYWDDDVVDWKELLNDWAREQSEEQLYKAFKHLEIEVEV